ncbi:transferase family protein [Hirsutella rhossiliensis]|uniref:Transferase family domain-containing protein n=1 Tax=Hirsutella rhossiliensis TaxID=111463 RepID=A0A9P8N6Y6_9HYPO|nr:transferase family domain-containing protein [Hirsutella rhossiliensis]KAH0966914.1 transferase family domain-containing protein [Hirsutella rhossiliensis]
MISQFLKPSRVPLIPGHTKLSPFDQLDNRFVSPIVLIFRVESADWRDSIIQDLQGGLVNTIEEMPFLAADVVPDNHERGTVQLETVEGGGVWFHVREYPELDIEDLERRRFAPASLPVLELVPEPRYHNRERCPVLNIQASFITGGLLLVTNFHHAVMDVSDVIKPESLDRTQVSATHGSGDIHISELTNYAVMKDGLVGDRQRELVRIALEGNTSHPAWKTFRQLTATYWNISQESLQSIKRAVPPSASEGTELTGSTVLSALLWRHISRARQLLARGIKTTSVVNMVDIRRRLSPPLPFDYSGNALTVAKTTIGYGVISEPLTQPLKRNEWGQMQITSKAQTWKLQTTGHSTI